MGWAPLTVEPVVRHTRRRFSVSGVVVVALLISASVLMWQNQWLVVDLPPPTSEWAFEETDLRAVQADGLSGEGVRSAWLTPEWMRTRCVCIQSQITFKDLIGTSRLPVDYGAVAHGTLMSGLLLSNDSNQRGGTQRYVCHGGGAWRQRRG